VEYCDFFFSDELRYSREELLGKAYRDRAEDARQSLEAVVERVRDLEWTHDDVEQALRVLAEELETKAGDLFSLVRVAVTGKRVTPPLFESMEVLGRERCLARLRAAVDSLSA
jgi:glutamyl-tRNA synthetase